MAQAKIIEKILIANRGEIACRLIRTARRLNKKTVAIYSEADQHALHVCLADEAFCIGPAPATDSYLNIPRIIEALYQSGADAVHPGYGFLSENAEFARAVEAAGAIFIGPSADHIQEMGDKLRAKEKAAQAGVPLIPGSAYPVTNVAEIDKFIQEHGLPILLKAASGGGGKGMRVVRHQEEIENALARTQSEALSSFHDDRVFIEKFIENPRHIEIQILGDHHGNILHFGERDCSLQRRHQKVIEETPAPHLCPSLRQQMISAALELAKSLNYFSAGTVEFIVTPDHQFYFLEVNTRLQVEHPITEEVYGVDIVELMILIAEGKPLPFTQSPLSPQGHAIEARLYAEDPDNDFLPSSGQLVHYHSPSSSNYLRIDTGIREGDNVSIYYDPMLAKIITKADSRSKALALLQQALSQFIIEGIDCNLSYLQRLLATPEVVQGHFHTHTIQEKNSLLSSSSPSLGKLPFLFQQQLACIALSIKLFFDPYLISATQWVCACKEEILEVTLLSKNHFQIHQTVFEVSLQWLYQHSVFTCSLNGHPFTGTVRHHQNHLYLTLEGQEYCFFVERSSIWPLYSYLPLPSTTESSHLIKSPMPGILKSLYIKKGDSIKKGQPIAVIEAMKMENTLRAPQEGKIVDLKVQAGQNLTKAQIIACLE